MDDDAFRAAYAEYRTPLYRFGYRLTGSPAAAEDLVHDCFAGLYRGGYDPGRGGLRSYLFGALRNLARKQFREAGRDYDAAEPAGETALAALIARETAEAVRIAVGELPPLQREALILFEYEELPLEEIAAIVGADVGAVKSRLHRARERLRAALAPLREVA